MPDQRIKELYRFLHDCHPGETIPGTADALARKVGCRDRHELNRILRSFHLPSPCRIRALARILQLRSGSSTKGSGYRAAMDTMVAPEWLYRTCRRVVGARWSEVRTWPHERIVAAACHLESGDEMQSAPRKATPTH